MTAPPTSIATAAGAVAVHPRGRAPRGDSRPPRRRRRPVAAAALEPLRAVRAARAAPRPGSRCATPASACAPTTATRSPTCTCCATATRLGAPARAARVQGRARRRQRRRPARARARRRALRVPRVRVGPAGLAPAQRARLLVTAVPSAHPAVPALLARARREGWWTPRLQRVARVRPGVAGQRRRRRAERLRIPDKWIVDAAAVAGRDVAPRRRAHSATDPRAPPCARTHASTRRPPWSN